MSGEFDDELPDESGPLPTDDGEEEGEESEDGDAEEEAETPVVAKTTPAPPPQKLVKKPRSGKKKPPIAGKPNTRPGPAPQLSEVGLAALNRKRQEGPRPGVGTGIREADRVVAPESIDPSKEPTGDAMIRWPLVLDLLREHQLGPDAVAIRVWVITEGPYATSPAQAGTIDGRAVAGSADVSPADQLRDYVETVFHSVTQKPAKYALDIYYKVAPPWRPRGGNMICRGELVLPSYDQLVQQRQRASEFLRRQSPGMAAAQPMPNLPTYASSPQAPAPLSPHVLQTLQAMGYQITPIGGAAPPLPVAPSFSEDITRELLSRMLRGEPIGPPTPAPVVIPAAAAPVYEPQHVPSITEQLQNVAQLLKLVDQIRPPAPVVAAAPVGVGRAVAAAEPVSPFAGLREAFKMVREATNFQEELAVITGRGDDDETPAANPIEKPFEVMEVAGVGKWPYGDKLSTFEQIKTFAMLNPDITMGAVSKASEMIDKSALGAFFRFLIERGTAAQRTAAQGAISQGMARPIPGSSPPPAMPPVIRPPAFSAASPILQPQTPFQNGAAPAVAPVVESPPAPVAWSPMT